jgi:hypothetical protein
MLFSFHVTQLHQFYGSIQGSSVGIIIIFQIFHFIQLEQFHASIGGSFMTFFFGFHSPPNLQQFHSPIWGPWMMPFIFPFPHLAQLQQFHGSVRRPPLMIFFPFSFFHSPFHPLATISMGICGRKRTKVDNRSDQVIL